MAKTIRPLPDTFTASPTSRPYRQRYLDLLMSDESRGLVIGRTRIVAAVRGYLDEEGFLEVETPILQPRYGGASPSRSSRTRTSSTPISTSGSRTSSTSSG